MKLSKNYRLHKLGKPNKLKLYCYDWHKFQDDFLMQGECFDGSRKEILSKLYYIRQESLNNAKTIDSIFKHLADENDFFKDPKSGDVIRYLEPKTKIDGL